MVEYISKVLIEAINNNDFKLITEKLSFEERDYFINHIEIIIDGIEEKIDEINESLFFSSLYTSNEVANLLGHIETYGRFKRIAIIAKLSDEQKIQYLDKFLDEEDKVMLIGTLTSDELKIQYLDKFNTDFDKAGIIESLTSDELKIQYLDKFNIDFYKAGIIKSLTSDELKIQYLDKFDDDFYKAGIIKSLTSDELKIQYLDKLNDYHNKIKIISGFKSEDSMLSGLEKIGETKYELFKKIKDNRKISLRTLLFLLSTGNENIKTIINDEEILNKFIGLFNNETASLNKTCIDSALETILSKEFSQNKSDIWEVFSRIKGMSERVEVENITQELLDILKYSQSTKNLVGRELGQFIADFKNDKSFLTKFIVELIDKNPQIKQNALDRLKSITSQYINLQMEDYKIDRKSQIFADNLLGIDKKVERNYLLKYVTEHYDTDTLSSLIYKFYPDKLSSDYFSNGITLKDVLEWKTKDPKNAPKEIKLCFKELNKILIQLYDEHYYKLLSMLKAQESEVKYDDKLEINNSDCLEDILSKCDLKEFFELCSPENSEKYKIIMELY